MEAGMNQLPMSLWQVYYDGGYVLCLAMHTKDGYLHWTRAELTHPLENFSRDDDLKSVSIQTVDGALVV